ncbi:MAG: SurA N-terminal domain-containing protein [Alphaproteobacteria bacterium]|nr:SurA N-terminal domain-containing protein [Alphaproteobacteria bacterium]
MIQAFQKFSQSRIARVFLAIVALSFVAFFGGGSWFRPHDPNAVVAQVGDLSISRYELAEKVQEQIHRVVAQTDGSVTRDELLKEGMAQMVLSQLIQEILLNLEAEHLGVTVSDETLRHQIQSIKAFQNEKGVFDRVLFTQLLRSNGRSEDSFIAEVRQELIREQLKDAVMIGAYLPDEMVNRLFDAQYQYRQASTLIISPKEMPAPPPPNTEVLEAFYNKHQKEFKTPELRTITTLVIDPALIAKEIPVSEDDIKATYEAKSETFGKKPLEEVRELIVADVQKEKANEKVYKVTQDIDEKIAGGATFEELAPTVKGAQLLKLEQIDKLGRDKMGEVPSQLPQNEELAKEMLQVAFGLEEGTDTPFSQAHSGPYYTVRVDKVSPASFQPFADIKNQVLKIWTEAEQLKAAQLKAKAYVDSFNQGHRAVSMMTLLPSLSLSEPSPSVSDEIKNEVFSLRPQQAGMTWTPEGFALVVLNTVIPPDPKVKEEKLDSFKETLLKAYQSDLLIAYLNALRIRYPVKVNSEAMKALFSSAVPAEV